MSSNSRSNMSSSNMINILRDLINNMATQSTINISVEDIDTPSQNIPSQNTQTQNTPSQNTQTQNTQTSNNTTTNQYAVPLQGDVNRDNLMLYNIIDDYQKNMNFIFNILQQRYSNDSYRQPVMEFEMEFEIPYFTQTNSTESENIPTVHNLEENNEDIYHETKRQRTSSV